MAWAPTPQKESYTDESIRSIRSTLVSSPSYDPVEHVGYYFYGLDNPDEEPFADAWVWDVGALWPGIGIPEETLWEVVLWGDKMDDDSPWNEIIGVLGYYYFDNPIDALRFAEDNRYGAGQVNDDDA